LVTKVVMLKLSLTMTIGTVGKWYKKEGDTVQKDEPIVEIMSEKATYDLEAPASGILRKILVEEGRDVPVNEILAVITAPDETLSEVDLQSETREIAEKPESNIIASPAAKRLAREHEIDLSHVKGSGPEGRISEEDVQQYIKTSGQATSKVKETIRLTGYRKTSAERLTLSFSTAPHSTVLMEVDMSSAEQLHRELSVSYTAILVKAVAEALAVCPMVNSTLEEDTIKILEEINVGVAVATDNGLIVPVIHHADKQQLVEIDRRIAELSIKARDGKLSKEEISGGTFTITNLGMYGVDLFIPIINPPEAAILGVGKIAEKPVAVGGKVEIRPLMTLSLAYDHRIIDGVPASEFLRKIKENIEKAV
jgi:pyruvate dehydrogenase E2 component (dihydrolipoamide acetyltransferase)